MNDDTNKTFVVRYQHDGAEWGLRLLARDYDDAKARLLRLPYARIDGELMATMPATTGPLVVLFTGLQNAANWLLRLGR